MPNQSIRDEDYEDYLNQYTLELLEVITKEGTPYPWDPAEPEAEAYFAELEQGFPLGEWLNSEEVAARAETLFSQLHDCWASLPTSSIQESLSQRFGNLVPSAWLEAIANRAQQVISTNASPLEQLVLCVKPLLSNWAEEDLQVFARPLVYAMRGKPYEDAESTLSFVRWARRAQWDDLSPVERVRLSMAVTQYALIQLRAAHQ